MVRVFLHTCAKNSLLSSPVNAPWLSLMNSMISRLPQSRSPIKTASHTISGVSLCCPTDAGAQPTIFPVATSDTIMIYRRIERNLPSLSK